MHFSLSYLSLLTTIIGTAQGVIELLEPELPDSVVIRGEGEIVDPDKWTEFPTPPPVYTDPPTPYPTPMSPAPTPINYILMESGQSGSCVVGTDPVVIDDCLDAGTLVAPDKHFPFYVEELTTSTTMPCGCYILTKEHGQQIIEYNACGLTDGYVYEGNGICKSSTATVGFPSHKGQTTSELDCQDLCAARKDCNGFTWNSESDCYIHFPSIELRNTYPMAEGFTAWDGCGGACGDSTTFETYADPAGSGSSSSSSTVILYTEDNFGGTAYGTTYPSDNTYYGGEVFQSMKMGSGHNHVYTRNAVTLSHTGGRTFYEGSYTLADLRQVFPNLKGSDGYGTDVIYREINHASGVISTVTKCNRKYFYNPPGYPNSNTQLVCKLEMGIDAGVDDLTQWDKAYGHGVEAYGFDETLWDDITSLGDFYVRRTCVNCVDSHKDIIYHRVTPLPENFDVKALFLTTWSSTNNVLGVDFNLYSSMSYALADIMTWTYCNYNDVNVGFPRDCGPNYQVDHQWTNLATGGGQQTYAYYIWHGNPELSITEEAQCTGSEPNACGCQAVNQRDYRGTVSVTRTGLTCQNWSSQSPHAHNSDDFPDSGLGDHNYCRNPSGGDGAWCLTTDPEVAWDYCAVPMCTDGLGYDHEWYKKYPFEDNEIYTIEDITEVGAVDVAVVDADKFGLGDFRIEMDVRGKGGSTVGTDGSTSGTLMVRSSSTTAPYDGPTVSIDDSGLLTYRVRSDEAFTCAFPSPSQTSTRHLEISRVGNSMFVTIDGSTTCTGTITKQPTTGFISNAPLRFGGAAGCSNNEGGLMIPLYIAPEIDITDGSCTSVAYQQVANSAGNGANVIAIVNPNNGPNYDYESTKAAYDSCIAFLREANVEVIGYVHTKVGYPNTITAYRNMTDIKADIDMWKNSYTVDGIFIDEVTNSWPATNFDSKETAVSTYTELVNYVLAVPTFVRAVLNPGSAYDEELMQPYYGNSKVIAVVMESTVEQYYPSATGKNCVDLLYNSTQGSFSPGPFCPYVPNWDGIESLQTAMTSGSGLTTPQSAIMLYDNVGGLLDATKVQDIITKGGDQAVGWFYVTDQSGWTALPSEFIMSAQTTSLGGTCNSQNLNMDILNIRIHGVPNPTASPTVAPTLPMAVVFSVGGADYVTTQGSTVTNNEMGAVKLTTLGDYSTYGPIDFGDGTKPVRIKLVHASLKSSEATPYVSLQMQGSTAFNGGATFHNLIPTISGNPTVYIETEVNFPNEDGAISGIHTLLIGLLESSPAGQLNFDLKNVIVETDSNPTAATAPPTTSPTACMHDKVTLSVTTDNYPTETYWSYYSPALGQTVQLSAQGTLTERLATYEYEYCIQICGGSFTMQDSYGDGLGYHSGHGAGTYTLWIMGQQFTAGHTFDGYGFTSYAPACP
mmetsp:Transcript_27342/g.41586  ORF Transcript_27342/g.41586 Transcript_27342/m.41586 type:complete len:1401 (+) Transcript_27342:156-4358(+)